MMPHDDPSTSRLPQLPRLRLLALSPEALVACEALLRQAGIDPAGFLPPLVGHSPPQKGPRDAQK